MNMQSAAIAAFALSASVSSFTPSAATAEIGVFAAANQDLTGARPTEAARPLFIQDRVVANERIASSTDGGGQILFLDQSSLTISPNSDIVLDQYVYNADTDSGELGLTVLKGAMRLVGGRITKKTPALIRTPSATIGIRGGMGTAVVGDDGVTRYMHIAGISSTITTDGGELTITREGGFAEISPNGEIEYLGVATEDFVKAAYSKRSTGSGGGGGTIGVQQTNQGADDVEQLVSADEDATKQGAISTTGEQQDEEADERAFDTASNDAEEEAAENFVQDLDPNVDQVIDGLVVFGTYDAVITADFDGNGTPGVQTSQQDFVFAFSLQRDQGLVVFALPETGDDLSADAETRADIAAVGLDTVLNRAGAGGIVDSVGVDGFLVSGFPLPASSAAIDPQVAVDSGGTFVSTNTSTFLGSTDDLIVIGPDDTGSAASTESFAGGELQSVNLIVDGAGGLSGTFDVTYGNDPEFESLQQVVGGVDLVVQPIGDFATDVDGATDGIRDLIEQDEFDGGPGRGEFEPPEGIIPPEGFDPNV